MDLSKPIRNPTSEIIVTRDDFETWLFSMDEELDAFFSSLPANIIKKLDYSLDSLLELEALILKKFDSINSIMATENKLELDRLARYVGESIRKSVGGKWDIELDDPSDAFYRLPVMTHEKYGRECPVTLVTASTDRRKGDYIFKVANNKKKRMTS